MATERAAAPLLVPRVDGTAPNGTAHQASEPVVTTRFELPTRTIVKVVFALVVLWLLVQLSWILLQLFCALLLAAALDPYVTRMERRGWPRPLSVVLILAALLACLTVVGVVFVPPLIDQGTQFATNLPGYLQRGQRLFENNPELYQRLQDRAKQTAADPSLLISGAMTVGAGLLTWLSRLVLIVTMTAYLLVDGERTLFWIERYLSPSQRVKVSRTLPQISQVVSGYIAGQLVTSLLFGAFAFGVLTIFHVPQALLLALVAAIADAIPIIGVFIATAPPVLLALTVSQTAAVAVLVLYVAYQQVENYLIVPRVYRGTMQISSFAVLIAVTVGAQLLGILGVLLALPVAAAIPAVERVWREESTPTRRAEPAVAAEHASPLPPPTISTGPLGY